MTDIPTGFLVDYRGLAEALGMTERWARAQTSKRALARPDPIPHYKVGPRLVRFNIQQVLDWLNRTQHFGGAQALQDRRPTEHTKIEPSRAWRKRA